MAIFAGGCFWGVEYFLQKAPGVISVTSGYTGGVVKNPTYKEVCTGNTGHAEAVKIVYNPGKTSYETLLRLFLEIHDPTQVGRQGPDIGDQYRSEIFYMNDDQKKAAEKCLNILNLQHKNMNPYFDCKHSFWRQIDGAFYKTQQNHADHFTKQMVQ